MEQHIIEEAMERADENQQVQVSVENVDTQVFFNEKKVEYRGSDRAICRTRQMVQ